MQPHETACMLEPRLAPHSIVGIEIPYEELVFPYYASIKCNGHRAVELNGEFYSRAMKPTHMHHKIRSYFDSVLEYAREYKIVLDVELHSGIVNTVQGTTSILAGTKPMPYDFGAKVFGIYTHRQWHGADPMTFEEMLKSPHWENMEYLTPAYHRVQQHLLFDQEELKLLIDSYSDYNIEGFMLCKPDAIMKHGRLPENSRDIVKLKFYSDPIDAKIINITSRRVRKAGVESEYNPGTGGMEQVHRQDAFQHTSIGGVLVARLENGDVINVPFPVGTSMQMRSLYYKNFRKGGSFDLDGKWICFRKLSQGEKNKPQAIKCVEFRDDKE